MKTDNGMEITADKKKAEKFNKYFSSVFVTEDVTHMPDKLDVSASQFLDNVNFSQNDILQLLLKINACKSPGPDNIHPRVLKECAAELSLPLFVLFTMSVKTGTLPEQWKGKCHRFSRRDHVRMLVTIDLSV